MLIHFMSRHKKNIRNPCDQLVRIFWVLEKAVLATHRSKCLLDTHKINGENKATKVLLLDSIENPVLLSKYMRARVTPE
jgi:hypothetical protein